jgi:hypothetical protein
MPRSADICPAMTADRAEFLRRYHLYQLSRRSLRPLTLPKLGSRPDPNARRGRDEGQHLAWPSWPASPAPIGPPLLRRRGHARAASRGATQLAAPSSRRSPSLSRHWRGLRTRSPRRRHATTDPAMRPPRVYPRRIRGADRGEPGPVRTDRRSSILPGSRVRGRKTLGLASVRAYRSKNCIFLCDFMRFRCEITSRACSHVRTAALCARSSWFAEPIYLQIIQWQSYCSDSPPNQRNVDTSERAS